MTSRKLFLVLAVTWTACVGKTSDRGNQTPDGTDAGVCIPFTCESAQKNCGELLDGCGGILTCGDCADGQTCGGSGVANVCGLGTCTPHTCFEINANCGNLSDGCSKVMDCGGCIAPQTCGGGGVPNVCGGKVCTIPCTGGATCQDGMCVGANYSSLDLDITPVARVVVNPPPFDAAYCDSQFRTFVAFRHVLTGRLKYVLMSCDYNLSAPPSAPISLGAGLHTVQLVSYYGTTVVRALPDTAFSGDVVLDLPAPVLAPIQGKITSNGGPLPLACSAAKIHLKGTLGGNVTQADVNCTTGAFSVKLPPDSYQATLDPGDGQTFTAPNPVIITGPNPQLVVEMPMTIVSGTLLKNGGSLPSCVTRTLRFTGPNGFFYATLSCPSGSQRYSVVLQKGVYTGFLWSGNEGVFPNDGFDFPAFSVSGDTLQTVNLNVPVTFISGKVTINGLAGGVTASGLALHFQGGPAHPFIRIPISTSFSNWTYSSQIYPGTYDWVGVFNTVSPNLPSGTTAFAVPGLPTTFDVGMKGFDIDLKPMNVLGGRVLRSGGPIGASCATLQVTSSSLTTGTMNLACDGNDWTWSGMIYPGPARAAIANWPPIDVTLNASPIVGSDSVDLDFVFARFRGEMRSNGQPLSGSATSTWVVFTDPVGSVPSTMALLKSIDGGWRYVVAVQPDVLFTPSIVPHSNSPKALPATVWNPNVSVSGPSTGETVLDFDMPVITVSGNLLNGGQPIVAACPSEPVNVTFTEVSSQVTSSALLKCAAGQWTYSVPLRPGTYQVDFAGNASPFAPLAMTPLVERLEVK